MIRSLALRLAAVGVLLVLWWAVAAARIWPETLVPDPSKVWHQLTVTTTDGYSGYSLQEHLLVSMRRILLGSLYGVVGGIVLGLFIGLVPTVNAMFGPFVTFVRTLPPLAYFYLLIIWFGIYEASKVWLLLIAALPPVAVATAGAVRGVPEDYVNAARSLGARRWQVPFRIVLPSALPEVFTGIRVAVGIAYTSVVAAETVNGIPGIGGLVRDAQRYNQTDVVVLGIIVIGLSGLVIDGLLQLLERRLVPWRGKV